MNDNSYKKLMDAIKNEKEHQDNEPEKDSKADNEEISEIDEKELEKAVKQFENTETREKKQ